MPEPSPERRRLRAQKAGILRHDPGADTADIDRNLSAVRTAERIRSEIRHVDDIDAWAERTARALDPLTPAEAAVIGRLAAVLDARRRSIASGDRVAA